jgi:hypothetical protein
MTLLVLARSALHRARGDPDPFASPPGAAGGEWFAERNPHNDPLGSSMHASRWRTLRNPGLKVIVEATAA